MEEYSFDVNAKVPARATKEEFYLMLRRLLVERFALRVHRDTKNMPRYELLVAKSGAKLSESALVDQPAPPFRGLITGPEGFPLLPGGNQPTAILAPGGKVALRGRKETAEDIAAALSREIRRPVINRTGLQGTYDYSLYYDMSATTVDALISTAEPGRPGSLDISKLGPNLFEAVRQQLGLMLIARKGPVPILVVDSAEKTPSEN